jgi:hypothetical protein
METIISQGAKNYLLDLTGKRITFLDSRFYFDETGTPVPSVTTILDCYPKGAAFFEWLKKNGTDSDEIRDEAGRKGSRVHAMTERYDLGEEVSLLTPDGDISMNLAEWNMFEKYVSFRERFQPTISSIELNMVSSNLGYAGTLDRIIELNGKTILLDIKTSGAVYPHYWLQLAAYEQLLAEAQGQNPIDQRAILWLNAKTKTDGKGDVIQGPGWQLLFDPNPAGYSLNVFKNVYELWKAEYGTISPRKSSYALSHQFKPQ